MISFADKVVIVTGSSRGIGEATAKQMASAGAAVVVCSRKLEACESVVAEIAAAGGEAVAMACNIDDKESLQALVDQTIARYGRLDTVVCNAAVNPHYGSMSDIGDEAYNKTLNANVRGTHWLCQMAKPHLEKTGGSVVLLSSVCAFRGSQNIGTYAITKAAEIALMRNLALEWGPLGMRANCIAPGLIQTEFARGLWENPAMRAKMEN
ncbi:MAG: SDR family NAD(P)-dependent oxidoreductase, partial [Gammaproteobacteria bacterium]|nr:SDR family NAD(P)-dependent oxidoreductase [Gammaproteobacteria bacterium]